MAPEVCRFQHGFPDLPQAVIYLCIAAQGTLVFQDNLGNGPVRIPAMFKQFGPCGGGIGKLVKGFLFTPGIFLFLFHHKPAPDGIIGLRPFTASLKVGLKGQCIGVEGKEILPEYHIGPRIKRDRVFTGQQQLPPLADLTYNPMDRIDGYRLRIGSGKAHLYREIGSMALSGEGKRSIEHYAKPYDLVEFIGIPKFVQETLACLPGAQGMGTRWADAHFQHVKYTDALHENWFKVSMRKYEPPGEIR